MNTLNQLLQECEQEHQDMWAVAMAEAKRNKEGLYKTREEAEKQNPNYGSDYFWIDENGYWKCF